MAVHLPASNKYQQSSAYRLLFVFGCLTSDRAMVDRLFSLLILGFAPRAVYVGFVLNKLALFGLFSEYCGFPLSVIVLLEIYIHSYNIQRTVTNGH